MNSTVYPNYINTSNAWLGEVPSHWLIKRLKFNSVFVSGYSFKSDDFMLSGVPIIRIGDIKDKMDLVDCKYWDESEFKNLKSFEIKKDDILLALTGATIGKSSIYAFESPALLNQRCAILRPLDKMVNSYLKHFIKTDIFREHINLECNGGAQENIGKPEVGDFLMCVPPPEEQRSIAAFLDYKTAQIDNLIEKKEQLLKLLEEKRIALITKAVTKGLDPNVKMKPSGIPWLGDIPQHWNLWQLKRLAQITYGVGGEIDKGISEGVRLLSLPNVTFEGNINLDEEYYIELNEDEKKEYLLKKGDLLFNWRNGSSDHLAKTAIINFEGEFTHVSFLLRLRFFVNSDSRYFRYLLNSMRATGFFSSSKAGVNNTFNLSELSNLFLMIPPLEEQIIISDYLDKELEQMISIQEVISQAIDKLKEYRTALITSAVTGKLDVRNFKPEQAA